MSKYPRAVTKRKIGGKRNTKNSATSPAAIAHERKRGEALQMRTDGFNTFQIAAAMNLTKSTVDRLINEAMAAMVNPATEELIKLVIGRLDMAMQGLAPRVVQGDDAAIITMLRVMDQLAKYVKIEIDQPIMIRGGSGGDGPAVAIPMGGSRDSGGKVLIEFVNPPAENAMIDISPNKTIGATNGHGNG